MLHSPVGGRGYIAKKFYQTLLLINVPRGVGHSGNSLFPKTTAFFPVSLRGESYIISAPPQVGLHAGLTKQWISLWYPFRGWQHIPSPMGSIFKSLSMVLGDQGLSRKCSISSIQTFRKCKVSPVSCICRWPFPFGQTHLIFHLAYR